MDEQALTRAVQALADCHRTQGAVAVLTGAGVSKESGIPTFRDAQTGMWTQFNPEDLATREGFLRDPGMVWDWYDFRRNGVWNAEPNAGHRALVEMEALFADWTLITQNVDNLHRRAGSQHVLELHGNIFRYKCLERNHPVSEAYLRDQPDARPPNCPMCASFVRPDVVWFGEALPEPVLNRAFEAASCAQVMLVAGTSGVVQPAASLPLVAREAGATVIEINPERSALTAWAVDCFLQGPSAVVLGRLLEEFRQAVAGSV